MARNIKTFHQIISKGEDTKNNHYKENTTCLYPRYRPQNKSRKNQVKIINFKLNLNKRHKRDTFNNFANTKSDINKTFRTLNHPYPMKIAIIKRNLRKSSTTSNHKSSTTKETYQIKNLGVSSNFQR
jgi:hypothetical protein